MQLMCAVQQTSTSPGVSIWVEKAQNNTRVRGWTGDFYEKKRQSDCEDVDEFYMTVQGDSEKCRPLDYKLIYLKVQLTPRSLIADCYSPLSLSNAHSPSLYCPLVLFPFSSFFAIAF